MRRARRSDFSPSNQANRIVNHRGRADPGLPMARTERTMVGALDRIGREQLLPNKLVTCLSYRRISPA
jgi:hypothetical protein